MTGRGKLTKIGFLPTNMHTTAHCKSLVYIGLCYYFAKVRQGKAWYFKLVITKSKFAIHLIHGLHRPKKLLQKILKKTRFTQIFVNWKSLFFNSPTIDWMVLPG